MKRLSILNITRNVLLENAKEGAKFRETYNRKQRFAFDWNL